MALGITLSFIAETRSSDWAFLLQTGFGAKALASQKQAFGPLVALEYTAC